ncbi:TFIIF-stimulated CTD phosphatase, putative [Trypanosoma equiperdum]|uniref:Mitochondrial import inner membrane translocase subunit TIM50 n=4 Tax=Trypanozoon TaxID=39700 RepID=Q38AF9_TRYB2|nr:TFIIF-stimulated CTD phosphatase, putative [Trypanosoma brucei gambiense DAL972]XP_823039.1 hypothetical protein, conserved [Trypanosoma brucei brucei TREU927]RHW69037.1 TFIIF-stimulated CTD phosphatase [Trypanosoma brucei equiperdum]SCU70089.1 TFIIF-stimulated CTD phosphatase, putative [Trypanosoma equiperdum]EAN78211.1 hypothetical protein, conserved [Trypanosoma brucei brucei TREU927]CBH15894.1 TFIIF-stimulated CTD phosphatase, putative [Trypanosoma brucei gambiense DAL972]|eukprot:XP_011778158.1 TFIIF-stimulated CTD phosphatase, putative [Trypanosoma brucei gambiense DAL972]
MPRVQRVRGLSFRQEYACNDLSCAGCRGSPKSSATQALIAPKDKRLADRPTIVLDLDETLVYAREGPLYVRPGLEELLQFLDENCETVLWTAGMKHYAEAVVRHIDRHNAVHHMIYRSSDWFRGGSTAKDLSLLGRDVATTIVFENTPDSIRGFEQNGVLVADYVGGELEDHTLSAILGLLRDFVERRRHDTNLTVPEFIRSSHRLEQREVPTDDGDMMLCYCLIVREGMYGYDKTNEVDGGMEPLHKRRHNKLVEAKRRWNLLVR